MAKEEFDISQTSQRDETKFTDEGKQKLRTLSWKGVDDQGIVILLKISGPVDLIEKKFVAFPAGPGTEIKMGLSTPQTTLTAALDSASQKNADTTQSLDALEESLKAATKN